MHEEKCNFSFFLGFHWSDFPYSSCCDIAYTSATNYVRHFRSVKNNTHITRRATYLVSFVAASIRTIFQKLVSSTLQISGAKDASLIANGQ